MKQVLTFLDVKASQGQTLEIIQGYTSTAQNRQLFVGLELCKKMLRLIADEDLSAQSKTIAFNILINVVQEKGYIQECIDLNVGRRVFDFLMKNVKQDMSEVGSAAPVVEDQKTEEGGTTKVYEVDGSFASPIQCALMLLTNLTILESGQKHLMGEGKTKGAIIENIFGMFSFFKTNPTFDFASNVMANVSSFKDGRRFMVEQNMLKQVLDLVVDRTVTNDHRRKQLLATLRNICFEYEDYEADFIQIDLVPKLIKLLV